MGRHRDKREVGEASTALRASLTGVSSITKRSFTPLGDDVAAERDEVFRSASASDSPLLVPKSVEHGKGRARKGMTETHLAA